MYNIDIRVVSTDGFVSYLTIAKKESAKEAEALIEQLNLGNHPKIAAVRKLEASLREFYGARVLLVYCKEQVSGAISSEKLAEARATRYKKELGKLK